MFQMGLTLPRETMANWYIYCAEEYFYPIYERMHELTPGASWKALPVCSSVTDTRDTTRSRM